jgi:uncharacterized protein YecE (DUF72 family)
MVKLWNVRTSLQFRFNAKFLRVITHEKKFRNCQKELELFYQAMELIIRSSATSPRAYR